MRRIHRVTISLAAAISLISLYTTPTLAATTAITGGSYGASCSSGGYFTPSSVTINSGDAVTISVPSNDPYSGGIEVHGFPQGNFVVARGGSVTTNTLTSNVSYYATWPNAGCTKGSGTITVSAPAPPPPPPPAPTPPPSPTPQATPTPSGISSNTKAGPSSSTPSDSASSPSPAPEPTPQPPSSTATNHSTPASVDTTATNARRISAKNVAVVSGGALMLIAIALVAWRLILRRRTPAAGGLSTKPPQDNDDPHNQTPTTT